MRDSERDTDLLRKIAAEDKAAMQAFYTLHHDGLFAFLRGRGADGQLAADCVQDAMLDVWRTAKRFGGRSSVKTWLYTIARNKLVDQQRKATRISPVEEVPDVSDPAPNPEAVALAASDAERVRACLAKLKPDHLTVMRLAFFEDLTYDDISEIEGIPQGTVKTRIFHAKKLLMRCLGRR